MAFVAGVLVGAGLVFGGLVALGLCRSAAAGDRRPSLRVVDGDAAAAVERLFGPDGAA